MFYIWYNAETGEILGTSEGEPYEYFDPYITSEIDPNDYRFDNCRVENGEIVISLAGYKYKAKWDLAAAVNSQEDFEVAPGKYIRGFEAPRLLFYRAYFQTARSSFVLPAFTVDGEETAIIYESQAEVQSAIDNIIAHITAVDIFKAQKKDAINAATTKEELEAIDLTPPAFTN